MSYSQGANERGVLFMAYNASIAEQFEVIQRWLTGGNSSGVSSSQSDPLLGVRESASRRRCRFTHGDQVFRVDLGDQPICKLEWGFYAFVPPLELGSRTWTDRRQPPVRRDRTSLHGSRDAGRTGKD